MELSVHAFVSLDGVMQGPGGAQEDPSNGFKRGGWLVPYGDADWGSVVDGWFRRADAILLGRTTFEMMRTYWSQVTDPVVVGDGKRLFADGATPATYEVTESESAVLSGGAVSLTLRQAAFGTIGTGEYVVREGKETIA